MNALVAWVVVAIVAAGIVALLLRGAYLLWRRWGVVLGILALVTILLVVPSWPPTSRLLRIAFGDPHPCGDGRTCIPKAGISLVLPYGWQETGQRYRSLLVAAPGWKPRTGVILTDGRDVLDPLPTDLAAVEQAARLERTLPTYVFEGEEIGGPRAEAERVELSIGEAVRVRYVASRYWAGGHAHIDYWFFADGRLLVLTYVGDPTGDIPTDSPAHLDDIVQSISLIE